MTGSFSSFLSALRECPLLAPCLFVLCLCCAAEVRAQAGVSALPSVYWVPSLPPPELGVRLALDAGYGYTGDVLKESDAHHRALAGVGAALTLPAGFAAELRLDGRYDAHHLKGGKSDSGGVLDPRLTVRYGRPVNERFSLGGQLSAWFPGKDFPKPAFDATTVDFQALATAQASDEVQLNLTVGYRIDNSASAADHPERFSRSDYLALGLSSFNSVLAGLGLRGDYGKGAVLAEIAAQMLVGAGAPSVSQSPMHVSAGIDQAVGNAGTRIRALVNVALSTRPSIDVNDSLVPVLPRFWVLLGLTQDFLRAKPQEGATPVQEPQTEPEPVLTPVVEPTDEPAQPRGVIRVVVRDTDWGDALDASVSVLAPGSAQPATTGRTTKLNEGMLELPVSPGRYEVLIEAKGYVPQRRTLSVDEGGVTVLNVDLKPKEKP
jgi:hypothetical protein